MTYLVSQVEYSTGFFGTEKLAGENNKLVAMIMANKTLVNIQCHALRIAYVNYWCFFSVCFTICLFFHCICYHYYLKTDLMKHQ